MQVWAFARVKQAPSDDVFEEALIGAAHETADQAGRDALAAEFGELATKCGHDDVVVTIGDVTGELAFDIAPVDPVGQRVLYAFEDIHIRSPFNWTRSGETKRAPCTMTEGTRGVIQMSARRVKRFGYGSVAYGWE